MADYPPTASAALATTCMENVMPILLWLLGIPIPIIILLILFFH